MIESNEMMFVSCNSAGAARQIQRFYGGDVATVGITSDGGGVATAGVMVTTIRAGGSFGAWHVLGAPYSLFSV